jgi:hypothetical protein
MKILSGDLNEADYCNYRGISLLSAAYKILSNTLLSRLTLHAGQIIWDYRCGFRRTSSTTDHVINIFDTEEKEIEYNETFARILIKSVKWYKA